MRCCRARPSRRRCARGLHYLCGLLAEEEDEREAALGEYERALALDPECGNALALLLDSMPEGGGEAAVRIALLLERVSDDARASTAPLLFKEGVYLGRLGHTDVGLARLERARHLAGDASPLGALCRDLIAERSAASNAREVP